MWGLAFMVSGFVLLVALIAGSLGWNNPPTAVSLLLAVAVVVFVASGLFGWVKIHRQRRQLRR